MALTIQQPWAEFIMAGMKTVENRIWRASHRGVLLIHAGKKFDTEWINRIPSMEAGGAARTYLRNKMIATFGGFKWRLGGVVGAVLMVGCDMNHNNSWCEYGCWYHRYRCPERFEKIIRCGGRLKLFQPELSEKNFDKEDLVKIENLRKMAAEYGFEEV